MAGGQQDWATFIFTYTYLQKRIKNAMLELLNNSTDLLPEQDNVPHNPWKTESLHSSRNSPRTRGIYARTRHKGTYFNIRQIIEKLREFNKLGYLCFVDYQKAFDQVKWNSLWNIMTEMGIPQHFDTFSSPIYMKRQKHEREYRTSWAIVLKCAGDYDRDAFSHPCCLIFMKNGLS